MSGDGAAVAEQAERVQAVRKEFNAAQLRLGRAQRELQLAHAELERVDIKKTYEVNKMKRLLEEQAAVDAQILARSKATVVFFFKFCVCAM